MRKIVTVTLNPAIDIHYEVPQFEPFGENYVNTAYSSVGGKGINVSKALNVLGIENTAVVVLGKDNAEGFEKMLKSGGVKYVPILTEGKIRENVIVHTEGESDTRISLDNFSIDENLLCSVFDKIDVSEGDIVVFAGRLPKGIKSSLAIDKLKALKNRGILLVVDCNSFSSEELVELSPWLIKPNESEIEDIMGFSAKDDDLYSAAAKKLNQSGIDNVIISLGDKGALYYNGDFTLRAEVPKITPLSTVGAGDSTLAGFISAFVLGFDPKECLKNATATGTAACLTKGTEPPERESIVRIRKQIKIL